METRNIRRAYTARLGWSWARLRARTGGACCSPPLCFLDISYAQQTDEQQNSAVTGLQENGVLPDQDVKVEYESKFLEILRTLFGN
jgi:hypothetical protein